MTVRRTLYPNLAFHQHSHLLHFSVQFLQLSLLLALDVKVLNQVRYIVIVIVIICSSIRWLLLSLLNRLVRFGELAQRCKGIRAELVKNSRYEFRKFFHLTGTIDGKCVRGNGSVNLKKGSGNMSNDSQDKNVDHVTHLWVL
jgi:hypothetical protein